MSFFGVTIETIESARKHPDADRLDICTLLGMDFQFVTLREQFRAGDRVLYFPLESVLPENILVELGLVGKLAGAKQNRIKTAVLRGEVSQGIVAEPSRFLTDEQMLLSPEEITELLGVTKYEPEPNPVRGGTLLPLPQGVSMYDIEGADRFIDAAALLMERPVLITEKLEGSNFSITISAYNEILVNMRSNTIVPDENDPHYFWLTANALDLPNKVKYIKTIIDSRDDLSKFHNQNVTLFGELIGPKEQGNIYQLKEWTVAAFDIRTDRGFLDVEHFLALTGMIDIKTVPVLSEKTTLSEWLAGRTLKEASNGASLLNPNQLREGIVIRPMVEDRWSRGRLILKQHSPKYLAKSKL